MLDVRIARLAVLAVAVVALASSEAIRNDDKRGLTNDHSSGGPAWGSHVGVPIRQRRSPVPPPKKKKPFKLGAPLGLVTNQDDGGDDMMKPPPLLETILGGDGEETTMPLKGALDKLGGGDGPLSAVKMFVPPIGQVIALAVLSFILFILIETVYFTQVDGALGTGTGTGTGSGTGGTGSDSTGILGGLG